MASAGKSLTFFADRSEGVVFADGKIKPYTSTMVATITGSIRPPMTPIRAPNRSRLR